MVEVEEKIYKGVLNVGRRPTFNLKDLAVEVHLIEFPGHDLYGKTLRVKFIDRIRGEMRFITKQDLANQIDKDKNSAIEVLKSL